MLSNNKIYQISLIFVITIIYYFFVANLHDFSDPTAYLKLAHDFDKILIWEMDHPFQHRIGLIALHWVSFELFGVNDFSSFLPSFVIFLIAISVVSLICEDNSQLFFANLIILSILPYSKNVYPDLGAASFMLLSIYFHIKRISFLNGMLAILFAFIGFLFKETAYFIVFVSLFALLLDIFSRELRLKRAYYIGYVTSGIFIAIIYFGLYAFLYGDALSRLSTVSSFGNKHLWSDQTFVDLILRLAFEPLHDLSKNISPFFWPIFIVALVLIINPLKVNQRKTFVFSAFVLLTMCYIVTPTSITYYQPLPLNQRILLPLVLVFACTFGMIVSMLLRVASDRIGPRICLLIAFLVSSISFLHSSEKYLGYAYTRELSKDLHFARLLVAESLASEMNISVHAAESRTPSMIGIYNGFKSLHQNIISTCKLDQLLQDKENTRKIVILIDFKMSRFLEEAYGEKVCHRELKQNVPAEADILISNEHVLLAILDPT